MFLSLSASYHGYACAVKHSIVLYTKTSKQTQFFDWLVTSLKSVNQILENTPIIFDPTPLSVPTSIKFKNFDFLYSHHDISEINENSINEITAKYTRRYERLINTIKEQKYIYFIRYCKNPENIEEQEIIKFYENINNINPDLVFKFILMSDYDNLIIPNTLLNDKFIYVNLKTYIDDDILNETNSFLKIVKTYKCAFNIIHKTTAQ